MADATYSPKVYRTDGGNRQVVASGGTIDIETGGVLKVDGADVTDEVAALSGLDRAVKTVKVTLGTDTGNAGVLSWQNPESAAILIERVVLDITTPATGTPTVDVGSDGDGTGTSDDLLDGQTIGDAAKVLDNIDDQGTNGQSVIRLDASGGTTDFVTATASADPAGLVGSAYISYVVV